MSDKLQKIRASFIQQLPARLAAIQAAHAECERDGASQADLENLFRLIHTLKGASASFGLKAVSEAALEGERLAKEVLQAGSTMDAGWHGRMRDAITRMDEATNHVEPFSSSELPEAETARPKPVAQEGQRKRVFLCEGDPIQRQTMAEQMRCFGFEVSPLETLPLLQEAMKAGVPDAIVMDVMFPGRSLGDSESLEVIQPEGSAPVPAVFISAESDLGLRLSAARAGSSAFMVKPLNITDLCSVLAKLTSSETPEPYRVLVVDDDLPLAEYHAQILEEAGMETRIVTDPLLAMVPLIEMRPDLILMDMYMPGCNGMELAKTIRQIGAHFSIPIVFLSSETDEDKQFHAMRMGGDEFLTKPIKPHHLVTAVAVRAERMKILRSFMVRDSMTGLLNHTATRDHLDSAITQARRSGGEVCFAMIDVDKFKLVNDTYGHGIGDRVLIALSRLLQQRLRKSDIAGRFGGEEFAVVLPECDLQRAMAIMNDLRESFSAITFETKDTTFHSTFSCGVSALSSHPDSAALCKAADDALYQAKHGGRNRVVTLSGPPDAAVS
jgi:diguanylate cyclase (GGDEF)-like protein